MAVHYTPCFILHYREPHAHQRPPLQVLDGFSLDIPAGKTVALVGRSGSGKSTVVGLIQKLYPISSGCIRIDGTDITALDKDHLRSQVAVVDQEPRLFDMSLKKNIAYGVGNEPAPAEDRIATAAEMACVDEFLPNLAEGMDTAVGELGGRLSGGQRQRVAIARALIRQERIKVRVCKIKITGERERKREKTKLLSSFCPRGDE